MKEIEKLRPLPRLIHSFGVLPDSYVASMSYHEQLTWFCNYLQTVVIPTVNNNAEAGEELQSLFTQLQEYVDTYFDNLDVQEEINNKIDDLISDGTFSNLLRSIVNQDIQPQIDVQNNSILAMENQITALSSNYPIPVTSTSEMLDTTKLYVNTTNGYLYYYDGTEWTQSVQYQSTGISNSSITTTMLQNNSVSNIKIEDNVIGNNKFNKNTFVIGIYINSSGVITEDNTNSFGTSDYMYIGTNSPIYLTEITTTPGTCYLAEYDANYNFIAWQQIRTSDLTISSGRCYYEKTPNALTRYIRISLQHKNQVVSDNTMITYSLPTEYEAYYWYINNKDRDDINTIYSLINSLQPFDSTIYQLPYIVDKKVVCNKISDNSTAVYAGVECKDTITSLRAKYIWENKENINTSGTLALIINPNGVNKISDITNLSLHVTFNNDHFTCDVFGRLYDDTQNTYQRIMQENYSTTQLMDGETEHSIIISVSTSSNKIYVSVDNENFEGTFIPDSNIPNISNVIGKYGTFEHYTNSNMDNVNMPMVTYFDLRNSSNEKMLIDYFDRENGQLNTAPTGQIYHLINNSQYRN